MKFRCAAAGLAVVGWMALGGGGSAAAAEKAAPSDWIVGFDGPPQVPPSAAALATTYKINLVGAQAAAADMAKTMSKVLGVEVTSGDWHKSAAKHVLVITDAQHAPPDLAKRLDGKRLDAFLIEYPVKLDGREICLLVSHDQLGLDFPANYFLTRYMGVEWVSSGEIGEVLSPQPAWKMPDHIDDLQNPDYEHRFWKDGTALNRRWLAGGFRMQFHHNMATVFDPEKYANLPEIYPFYDGKRHVPDYKVWKERWGGWQPCVSNPKTVEIAVAYGLDFLARNPDQISFSLSVNDGGSGDCQCEACRAMDAKDAYTANPKFPYLTNRYFKFYNAVIEKVLEQNPKAYLSVQAYGRAKTIPEEGLKINPRICEFTVPDNGNPVLDVSLRQKAFKEAGALPCIYEWFWDVGFLTVRNYPHATADIVRLSHDLGGFGYYCEGDDCVWAASGPKLYVMAHVLWDTKANTDELLDRYMKLSFGPAAAPAMRAYFDRWEAMWELGGKTIRYNTGRNWRDAKQLDLLTRDDLAAFDADLAKALAAPASPQEKQRIGYVNTYYQLLRLNADQYLIAHELADPAWLARQKPKEVMNAAERGVDSGEKFNEMWKNTIAKDRTGWLMPIAYYAHLDAAKPYDGAWHDGVEPLRKTVMAAFGPALDKAPAALTQIMLKTQPKDQVAAFWKAQTEQHPKLAKWTAAQGKLLGTGEPEKPYLGE